LVSLISHGEDRSYSRVSCDSSESQKHANNLKNIKSFMECGLHARDLLTPEPEECAGPAKSQCCAALRSPRPPRNSYCAADEWVSTRQGAKRLRWCTSVGRELLLPVCASYRWLAGAQPAASPGNAKSNVGARTFEVRSSELQMHAAPVNQVRTDNEHHAQPRLNVSG
jgi:hypothetical protein